MSPGRNGDHPKSQEVAMSFRITNVRFEDSNNKTHDTITAYAYVNESTGGSDSDWKAVMVGKVEAGTRAFVGSGVFRVEAIVVAPTQGRKFLRTVADGRYSNNLLSLPTF
jgi:hypothetical protein